MVGHCVDDDAVGAFYGVVIEVKGKSSKAEDADAFGYLGKSGGIGSDSCGGVADGPDEVMAEAEVFLRVAGGVAVFLKGFLFEDDVHFAGGRESRTD